jgi:MerR family transcriptional regulator, thiopeptide resistance regulator
MTRPVFKPKPEAPAGEFLTAAECAARTGLTVKALRIYERQGLIKPPRSPNGWRRYGPIELERLNSIVILKGLGLTLSQIRSVLIENPPSLLRILRIHAESWRAKRAIADRALTLVQTVLERLSGHQAPSLAELCELIKGLQNNRSVDMTNAAVLTRQLINENITPEEERAWLTWLAEHPEDTVAIQEFTKNQKALSEEARQLMEQGVAPASDKMQDLLRRQNVLLLQYGMRERNRRLRAWNDNTLHKWCGLGVKMQRLADEGRGTQLMDYWTEAIKQSAWAKAFQQVMVEIREIIKTQSDPASADFDAPVQRIREICAEHSLGDALTFAQWRRFTRNIYGPYVSATEDTFDPEWEFIQQALQVRENGAG